jgi:hypothetical protein
MKSEYTSMESTSQRDNEINALARGSLSLTDDKEVEANETDKHKWNNQRDLAIKDSQGHSPVQLFSGRDVHKNMKHWISFACQAYELNNMLWQLSDILGGDEGYLQGVNTPQETCTRARRSFSVTC